MQKNISIRRSAQKLAKAGQVAKALAAYEPLLSSGEADPYDHLYVGDLHERAGNREEAVAQYEAAIRAYNKLGFHRNGVALCRKILRLSPDHRVVYRLLGDLYTGEELFGDALTAYLSFFDRTPADRRNDDEFRETLAAATAIAPRNAEMALKLAALLEDLDRLDEAAELLVRAAETARESGAAALAADLRARADAIDPGAALRVGVAGPSPEDSRPAPAPAAPPPSAPEQTDTIIALSAEEGDLVATGPAFELPAEGGGAARFEPFAEPVAAELPELDDVAIEALERAGSAPPEPAPRRPSAGPASFGEIELEDRPAIEMRRDEPRPAFEGRTPAEPDAQPPTPSVGPPEDEAILVIPEEPADEAILVIPEETADEAILVIPEEPTGDFAENLGAEAIAPETDAVAEEGPVVVPDSAVHAGIAARAVGASGRLADPAGATRRAVEAEQWASAKRRVEEWIQHDPTMEAVENLIEISRALHDNAGIVRGYTLKGDLLIRDGELQDAVGAFREVLRRDPQNETALRRMARFHELGVAAPEGDHPDQPGPVQAVLEARNTVVSVRPDAGGPPRNEQDWMEIGALLDEFREGVKEQFGENDPQAHYDLGVSHQEMGLFEEALEEFGAALACRDLPRELELRLRELRGKCFARIDRHREAIQELRLALEIAGAETEESAGISYLLGLEHARAGEVEPAKECMREVLRLRPDFQDARSQLATLEREAA